MYMPLILMAGIAALIAGLLTFAMARRYGRRRALIVPVLAVAGALVGLALARRKDL